jgi:hypothetical protein
METVAPIRQETRAGTVSSTEVTNALLACGVASGPFFYTLAIIQIVTRAGGGMVNASPRVRDSQMCCHRVTPSIESDAAKRLLSSSMPRAIGGVTAEGRVRKRART